MAPLITVPQLFAKLCAVSKKIKTPVYVVGGFVRDYVLSGFALPEKNKDIDFVVVGSGVEFARQACDALQGENFVAFENFDTARFTAGPFTVEFAGARAERYAPTSRKPQVTAVSTLEDDLVRRDFTVNAMAAEITKDGVGEIIDPLGSRADLVKKIIRTPLEPNVTFSDDPLRMIRAARFAGRFGFTIDPDTYRAMQTNVARLNVVSWERIREELDKILAHTTPSAALWHLFDTGLLEYIAPELTALSGVDYVGEKGHKDQFSHTLKVTDQLAALTPRVLLRWAGLLHDIGKAPTKRFDPAIGWTFHAHEFVGEKMFASMGRRLKFDVASIKYLQKLIRWHLRPIALCAEGVTDSAVRRLIVAWGEHLEDLILLYRADITTKNPKKIAMREKEYELLMRRIAEVREKDTLAAFQSPVRGEEIMTICGIKAGRMVGILKTAIEEAILDGVIPNEYEAAKQYLLINKDRLLKS